MIFLESVEVMGHWCCWSAFIGMETIGFLTLFSGTEGWHRCSMDVAMVMTYSTVMLKFALLCVITQLWNTAQSPLALCFTEQSSLFSVSSCCLPVFPVQGIVLCKCIKIRWCSLPSNKLTFSPGMGHGGDHGHGHGHDKVELPDYRQWKVEGTPLEEVQRRLAKRGLRDPWAR